MAHDTTKNRGYVSNRPNQVSERFHAHRRPQRTHVEGFSTHRTTNAATSRSRFGILLIFFASFSNSLSLSFDLSLSLPLRGHTNPIISQLSTERSSLSLSLSRFNPFNIG